MTRHVVCDLEALPEGGRIIADLGGGLSVGVFNIDGELVAFRNRCPHAGAPVCEGTISGAILSDGLFERHVADEGRILKCPWHAWEFRLPEGVTITEPRIMLRPYPVSVEDGKVVVEAAPLAKAPKERAP